MSPSKPVCNKQFEPSVPNLTMNRINAKDVTVLRSNGLRTATKGLSLPVGYFVLTDRPFLVKGTGGGDQPHK